MLVSTNSGGRAARPGDELHIQCEVLEVRPSRSLHDSGFIKLRTRTLNQNDEPVPIQIGNLLVLRRESGEPIRLLFRPGGFAQFETPGGFTIPGAKQYAGPRSRRHSLTRSLSDLSTDTL